MRVVFFGTPKFAADIFARLHDSHHEVIAVFTKADSVSKRGKKLVACETKIVATDRRVDVYTPKTLRDADTIELLKSFDADAFCVAAYGMILPREVLEIPRYGCINVHGSLLPRWRGAAPIERAILAGDSKSGVAIMRMDEGLDTGDVAEMAEIPIVGKTAGDVRDELAILGSDMLISVLDRLKAGEVSWTPQSEDGATYANKIEKSESLLDPDYSASDNLLRILASADNAPARCTIGARSVRIVRASLDFDDGDIQLSNYSQGDVVWSKKKLYLVCGEDAIEVLELKPDGKSTMSATSFAAGDESVRSNSTKWSHI